eukprot:762521-Hanusia_phi.AAC.9
MSCFCCSCFANLLLPVQRMDAKWVDGDERYNIPTHKGMFQEQSQEAVRPSKSQQNRNTQASTTPQSQSHSSELESPTHMNQHKSIVNEIRAAKDMVRKLSNRDSKLESAADQGANNLLKSYSDIFDSGIDEYQKMAAKVDAREKQAFQGEKVNSDATKNTKLSENNVKKSSKTVRSQDWHETSRISKLRASNADGVDPFAEERKIWRERGIKGHLLAVPREYKHEVDETGGSSTAVSNVPDFIKQAHRDLEDSDYVRSKEPSRDPSPEEIAQEKRDRLDAVEKEAKAPRLKVPKGVTLKQLVQNAVDHALYRQKPQNFQLASKTSDLYQVSKGSNSLGAQNQNEAQTYATDFAAPHYSEKMPDAASTLNSLEMPSKKSDSVRADLFRSTERHLKNEINSIFGDSTPSHASNRHRDSRKVVKKHLNQEIEKIRAMAQRVENEAPHRDRLKTAQESQVSVIKADSSAHKAELREVAQLRRQIRKLKEKAMVAKLKRQVQRLRQQVLQNEAAGSTSEDASQGSEHGDNQSTENEATEQAAGEDKSGESSENVDANQESEEPKEESEGQNQAGNEEKEGGETEAKEEDEKEDGKVVQDDEKEKAGEEGTSSEKEEKVEKTEEADKGSKKLEGGQPAKRIRVCDGLGCEWRSVAAPPPPPALNASQGINSALNGGGGLFDWLFPWEGSFSSEVSLNNKGDIRAHHDDPHGHLMPRNKYQNARSTCKPVSRPSLPSLHSLPSLSPSLLSSRLHPSIFLLDMLSRYPDGVVHVREDKDKREGITNQVATHLFADHIVPAAPGFNAGMGRHVRAQQAYDWDHNWETQHVSENSLKHGKKIVVG